MQLILASSSPRRRQLLLEANIPFSISVPDEEAEQASATTTSAVELVAELAVNKAENVARRTESGLVLAADTLAECNGTILGKPVDMDHARQMLQSLSGQLHQVHTAICLWKRPENRTLVCTETTDLEMSELSSSLLESYLASRQWEGKSGGFGLQDEIDWVRIQSGSESNVVGLPMERLRDMLDTFGFSY